MSYTESRRRSPTDRSESPRDDSRSRYSRRSSPPQKVHREHSTRERRDRSYGRDRERREHRYSERENPEESKCLGVFGMSTYTKEEDLRDVFSQYGRIEKIKIIYDVKTHHSRGYSFVYFENIEDAKEAKERCNNLEIGGKTVRVDFSVTKRAHSPTPGMYMGKRNSSNYDRRDRRGTGGDNSSRYDSRYRRDSYQRYERASGSSHHHQSASTHSRHRSRSYSRSPRR